MPNVTPNLDTVLCAAVEIADAAERAAYLDRACGPEGELRRRAEALVAAHFQAGSFLDRPVAAADTTVGFGPADGPSAAPGTVIGPYKLMELVGEGGMGVVYVAEQSVPVRRQVALKVIKPGMDTREVVARFEAERQALALMDHPNIARVLDAGATEQGRPYFVMELVRGLPVTEYCDQVRLPADRRLRLFVQVCRAVQHAHMKGVIHRDLKPTNVMVTLHDGEPVPKVIDFGVAKAVGQRLTDKTVYTRLAQLVGTPMYMSPEQAELSGLDIDTRSDVYSLGVLLYELLTGTTPFDAETFRTAGLDEVRRIIREQEPPRPSSRVSTLDAAARSTVSARRGLDDRQLGRLLRGDLDWVVMKSLEKDRNRRYESAGAFAADVERYLADEPIEARPPSAGYRLRKLARRNRAALMTAGLVAAALLTGTGVSAWQAIEAHGARRLADKRLGDEQLASAQAQASFRKALEAVDRTMAQVSVMKVASPQLHEMRRRLLEDSVTFYTELVALNPRDTEVYIRRGHALTMLGKADRARSDYERAIELDPEHADAHKRLGGLLVNYGQGLGVANWREVGLAHVKRAVELEPTNPYRHAQLGWTYHDMGRFKDAAPLLRRAAEMFGPGSHVGFFYLGSADQLLGNHRAAIANYEKSLAHGASDPWVNQWIAGAHFSLAVSHLALGENERALAALDKAVALPGNSSDSRGWTYFTRGNLYLSQNRYEDALSDFSNAVEFNPSASFAYKRRAKLYFRFGRYPEALADIAKSVELKPDDVSALTWISPDAVASCPDEGFRRGILGLADQTIERLRGQPVEAAAYVSRAQLHAAMKEDAKVRDDMEKAIASYREAIRLNPEYALAHNNLAWWLAIGPDGVRDGHRAVAHATRACELTGWKEPGHIDTLAAAHAEDGNFDKAVEYQKKALSFPGIEKSDPSARQRLDLYTKKSPYRDPAFVPRELAPPPRPAGRKQP